MISQARDSFLLGAVGAAEDGVALLDAMADHFASAMSACRRQRVDRTLETIECMLGVIVGDDCERLRVLVAAHFTRCHEWSSRRLPVTVLQTQCRAPAGSDLTDVPPGCTMGRTV
jgi:hypothetical protein